MNFRGSINLLNLKGAQILNVTLPNGRTEPCIVVPAAYNDMIRPRKDGNGMEIIPYVNFRAFPPHPNYIAACQRNHAGEENYVLPSHSMKVSFTEDFRNRASAAAERRIRKENPTITDADLQKQVAAAVNISLGDLIPVETQQRGFTPTGSVAATPADPSQFNTPQPTTDPVTGEVTSNPDDLPF